MNAQRPPPPPHRPRPRGAPAALEGLRVIDFTRMLAGPYSTQQLADFGAEVIKVETPVTGDDSRHYTTTALAGECAFYLSANRNKKSITLDLKTDAGRQVAHALIASADIVMENFTNGVMERFGLDYGTVCAEHPRLIYCSISGYGRDEAAAVHCRRVDLRHLRQRPTVQAFDGRGTRAARGRPGSAFRHNPERVRNSERLTALLSEAFERHPRDYWLGRLAACGVPAAPVATIAEAYASPDVRRREILSGIPHPTAGTVPNVRAPFLMGLTPAVDPVASPLLGQHTQEVLTATLGFDATRIESLAARGAFGPDARCSGCRVELDQ